MPKRKTQEEFEREVKDFVGNEYSILGEYKNNRTKIKMRHNCSKCNNYEYEVSPSEFLQGRRCPKCFGTHLKTQEEFEKEVYDLFDDEYSILGKYINSKTKIRMRHNCDKCNNFEYEMSPSNILKKHGCPKCFGNFKKTQEQFIKEVYDLVSNEYSVLGKYVNANTKIKIRHNCDKCENFEYEVLPNNFLVGQRCPKCSKKFRKTHKDFEKEVKDLVGDEYTILGNYINSKTKIKIRHNCDKCENFEYEVLPSNFLKGRRCPKCFGTHLKTHEDFEREVKDLVGDEYSILERYEKATTKIKMRHNCDKCNNYEYKVSPINFLRGKRCPKCNESKGEKAISEFLNKKSRKFKSQYMFKDCRNVNPLPFDIALLNDKKEIVALIEYDGEQHFQIIKKFDDENSFLQRKANDRIKTSYCENHLNSTPSYKVYSI